MARLDGPAQYALVTANLGLARDLSRQPKYRRWGLDADDLLQEARLGLCQAAKSFDPDQNPGVEFGAYARERIIGSMWDAIAHRQRSMSADELPDDVPSPDFDAHASRLESEVQDALDALGPADRQLIIRRFGLGDDEPMGPIELSELYGCTARRIHQRLEAARQRLGTELERRGWTGAKALEAFTVGRKLLRA